MMRTNRETKPTLMALGLVAGLAMYAGLARVLIEDVFAHAAEVHRLDDRRVVNRAGLAIVHTHEEPLAQVLNITASNSKFNPHQIRLAKRATRDASSSRVSIAHTASSFGR